ncbi:MAG: hypothetical protein JSW71_06530, partial [Gemmatimonadota bacterium]
VEVALARSGAFETKLRELLDDEGLDAEVAYIGVPGTMPVISIVGTRRVAERVKSLQEVDSVIEDVGDLGIVP